MASATGSKASALVGKHVNQGVRLSARSRAMSTPKSHWMRDRLISEGLIKPELEFEVELNSKRSAREKKYITDRETRQSRKRQLSSSPPFRQKSMEIETESQGSAKTGWRKAGSPPRKRSRIENSNDDDIVNNQELESPKQRAPLTRSKSVDCIVSPSQAISTKAPQEKQMKTKNRLSKSLNDIKTTEIECTGSVTPPDHWEEVWSGILEMRKKYVAAVDEMGCGSYEFIRFLFHFELVSQGSSAPSQALMLSSQTKDEVTHAAMLKLREMDLLHIDKIVTIESSKLDEIISQVGFHNKKVLYLRATARILKDEHGGDVPEDLNALLKLPGIGPKMAHLFLTHAYDKTTGIGVDVHVHRIANRLKWVHRTTSPESTRKAIEAWLPRDRWGGSHGINWLLVGFGQTICRPVNPLCQQCTVAQWCPSAFKETKYKRGDPPVLETSIASLEW